MHAGRKIDTQTDRRAHTEMGGWRRRGGPTARAETDILIWLATWGGGGGGVSLMSTLPPPKEGKKDWQGWSCFVYHISGLIISFDKMRHSKFWMSWKGNKLLGPECCLQMWSTAPSWVNIQHLFLHSPACSYTNQRSSCWNQQDLLLSQGAHEFPLA